MRESEYKKYVGKKYKAVVTMATDEARDMTNKIIDSNEDRNLMYNFFGDTAIKKGMIGKIELVDDSSINGGLVLVFKEKIMNISPNHCDEIKHYKGNAVFVDEVFLTNNGLFVEI